MRILTPVFAVAFFSCGLATAIHAEDKRFAPMSPALAERLKAIVPADELEASIVQLPVDPEALAGQAVLLSQLALHATEPEQARALRPRAYTFGAAATAAKSKSLLLPVMMAEIREDGSLVPRSFSANKQVSDIVADAEGKFAHGDLDGALGGYRHALELDPRCFRAWLFGGDVYFSRKDYPHALEWFDRAVAVDGSVETGHRYRADVLMRLGKFDEAGVSYVNAFVDSPFAPIPTAALNNWIHHQRLTPKPIDSSCFTAEVMFAEGDFQLGVKEKAITTLALAYGAARIDYAKQHHFTAASYRHSLAEETDALRQALKVAKELMAAKSPPADVVAQKANLERMFQVERDGLLEALVFFDRPDNNLAQDYPAYRAEHHDQLVRYLRQVWLGLR